MSGQENVQRVQEIFAAFGRQDLPAVLNALAEDVEWFEPGPPGLLPWAGMRRGREQVAEFLRLISGDALAHEQFEVRQFIGQGDTVVVLGPERSRVIATGRAYDSDWALVFRLRDGKVANFRAYHDTAAMVAAARTAPCD